MELRLIDLDEHEKRFNEIENIKNPILNNKTKVEYALSALSLCGKKYEVNPPKKKSMKMKIGSCYSNSIKKSEDGFEYVEGVITSKKDGNKISHAWNIDSEGNHYDFTLIDTKNYEYFGVVIPYGLLFEIGKRNGCIWYCSLPYLEIKSEINQ